MVYTHKDRTSIGSLWMIHTDGTTTSYPSDGQGATTTTAGSSLVVSAPKTYITSIIPSDTTDIDTAFGTGTNEVCTITDAAGNDLATFFLTLSNTGTIGINFPGEGLEIDGGFGVEYTGTTASDQVVVFFTIGVDP